MGLEHLQVFMRSCQFCHRLGLEPRPGWGGSCFPPRSLFSCLPPPPGQWSSHTTPRPLMNAQNRFPVKPPHQLCCQFPPRLRFMSDRRGGWRG